MAPYVTSQFKSISSRLAVKSLFNSKFDFESTAPGKADPTRLEVLKSTQVDLLGSTPRSISLTRSLSYTSTYLGLPYGQPFLFVAALVNKIIVLCAWLLSGALDICRIRSQREIVFCLFLCLSLSVSVSLSLCQPDIDVNRIPY